MRITIWLAGFLIEGMIAGAPGFGAAALIMAFLAARFCADWYEGREPWQDLRLHDPKQDNQLRHGDNVQQATKRIATIPLAQVEASKTAKSPQVAPEGGNVSVRKKSDPKPRLPAASPEERLCLRILRDYDVSYNLRNKQLWLHRCGPLLAGRQDELQGLHGPALPLTRGFVTDPVERENQITRWNSPPNPLPTNFLADPLEFDDDFAAWLSPANPRPASFLTRQDELQELADDFAAWRSPANPRPTSFLTRQDELLECRSPALGSHIAQPEPKEDLQSRPSQGTPAASSSRRDNVLLAVWPIAGLIIAAIVVWLCLTKDENITFVGALFLAIPAGLVGGLIICAIATGMFESPEAIAERERIKQQQQTRQGGPRLTNDQQLCMHFLRKKGVNAYPDNAGSWLNACPQVLRENAMGNYIGYTEYHRRHHGPR